MRERPAEVFISRGMLVGYAQNSTVEQIAAWGLS